MGQYKTFELFLISFTLTLMPVDGVVRGGEHWGKCSLLG